MPELLAPREREAEQAPRRRAIRGTKWRIGEALAVICIDRKDARAFSAGDLAPEALAQIEAHLVGCALCRDLVSATAHKPASSSDDEDSYTVDSAEGATLRLEEAATQAAGAPELPVERGSKVGRYTILERVGQGGFGEVFAAYDPDLDRKIAIKFLRRGREGGSAKAEARLLREAKTIAKLSHPNIVTVYDAGTFGARVFVAMEFVDGATLKDWLAERPRARREILDVFRHAARGLAGAHASGLVHRDFKPGNVMVSKDGRVLVMDFGLVRQIGAADDEASEPAASALAAENELDLTRTGELVGTPAYMAPEQLQGERTDARTDQFSFCVALYAALYGERPFAGEEVLELRTNVLAGRVRPVPDRANVPAWMRRASLARARGRAVGALLRRDDGAPRGARRRSGAAAPRQVARGRGRARKLAKRRSAARRALGQHPRTHAMRRRRGAPGRSLGGERPGLPRSRKGGRPPGVHADGPGPRRSERLRARPPAARSVRRSVGRHGPRRLRGDACARHAASRTSSRFGRPASTSASREPARTSRTFFVNADASVVENAISAIDALPPLETCSDLEALHADTSITDPAVQQRMAPLRERFARVQALAISGQCAQAEAQGAPLLTDLRAAGYRPLLAEALLLLRQLGDECVDARVSLARAKEAYGVATAAHLDRLAAEAALSIPVLTANRLGDTAAGPRVASRSPARRSNGLGRDEYLRGLLLIAEADVDLAAGDPERSVVLAREAYEVMRRTIGAAHALTLMALGNLGNYLEGAGHLEEAVTTDRRATDEGSVALGPAHPLVANLTYNLCEALNELGRSAEARDACLRALDIWRQAGTDEYLPDYARTGLGIALIGLGRSDEAVAPLEAAVRNRSARKGAPALLGALRHSRSRVFCGRGRRAARAPASSRGKRAPTRRATRS